MPMENEAQGSMNPQEGVAATRPASTPLHKMNRSNVPAATVRGSRVRILVSSASTTAGQALVDPGPLCQGVRSNRKRPSSRPHTRELSMPDA